jgi:hypothetical protein
MNGPFKAAKLHDGGRALAALLLQSATVDLTRPGELHPLFCVESVEGLNALLSADVPCDMVDTSGYCAVSLVFGRRNSTALLNRFLAAGVDPWREHPRLRFTLFDFALRRGNRADLELLLARFPKGRDLMVAHLDRALDNYIFAFDVAALFGEQLCTRPRLERALSFAREDADFYSVVAALIASGSREWLRDVRSAFDAEDRAAMPHFLLPRWSERIHWFCGVAFVSRVECLFLAMQRCELACDSLARHEMVKWLARCEYELMCRAQLEEIAAYLSSETSSTSSEEDE